MSVDVIGFGRYYVIVFVSLTLKHEKKKEARKKKPIWSLNVSLFFYGQSGPHRLSIFKKSA